MFSNTSKLFRRLAAASCLVGGLALVGCSGGPDRPGWVTNPYENHPESEFIAAAGRGDSMSDAEQNATAKVARQVSREIDLRSLDLEEYAQRTRKGGFNPDSTLELLELAEFDETREPLGFDIADRYEEQHKKRDPLFFAHGIVDRDEVARAYETEMRRNAAFGNRMIDLAADEDVTARKLSMLRAAFATADIFQELRFIQNKVGKTAYAGDDSLNPPRKTVDELSLEIADLRNSIAASIEVKDGTVVPDTIASEIRSALQAAGVPVRTDRGEGHIRVLVDWDTENINQRREDLVMVQYRLSIELVQDSSNFSFASRNWDSKEGGRDQTDAEANALRIARRDAERELPDFFRESLFEASVNAR
ncbi:MAG: hypothetical protein AAF108_08355 [Planctomycetota bacterium]